MGIKLSLPLKENQPEQLPRPYQLQEFSNSLFHNLNLCQGPTPL